MTENNQDSIDKSIVITGAPSSGKTMLLRRIIENSFSMNYEPSIIDFRDLNIPINYLNFGNEKEITIRFFDIAGQEDYVSFHTTFFKEGNIIYTCCILNNVEELIAAKEKYFPRIMYYKQEDCKIFVVATKGDLSEKMEPTKEFADVIEELKEEYNIKFFITSAKDGFGHIDLLKESIEEFNKGSSFQDVDKVKNEVEVSEKIVQDKSCYFCC